MLLNKINKTKQIISKLCKEEFDENKNENWYWLLQELA